MRKQTPVPDKKEKDVRLLFFKTKVVSLKECGPLNCIAMMFTNHLC